MTPDLFAFHAYLAAVLFGNGLDDCQSQSVAFRLVVLSITHAIEAVENKRQVCGGNSRPLSRTST